VLLRCFEIGGLLTKTSQAKEVCNQTADHKALIRKFIKEYESPLCDDVKYGKKKSHGESVGHRAQFLGGWPGNAQEMPGLNWAYHRVYEYMSLL
jgi:hypothetical protein